MKYEYEIVKNLDVITESEEECCEWGCGTDMDQVAGNY